MAVKKYWLIQKNTIINLVAVEPSRINRPGGWPIPDGCEIEECIDADQRDPEKHRNIGMVRARKDARFQMPAPPEDPVNS